MGTFQAALQSGQLGPLMNQFGMPSDVSAAASQVLVTSVMEKKNVAKFHVKLISSYLISSYLISSLFPQGNVEAFMQAMEQDENKEEEDKEKEKKKEKKEDDLDLDE